MAPCPRFLSPIAAACAAAAVGGLVSLDAQQNKVAGDRIFGLTRVHQIRIAVPAAEWAALQTSGGRNTGYVGGTDFRTSDGRLVHVGSGFTGLFPWARATIRVDGTEFKDVGLRYKGNFSFMQSSAAAPLLANFKLKLDVHGAKGTWDGLKTFNLHAGVIDTTRMKEPLAYAIFRAARVPAPRTAYAELIFTVPGIYQDASAGLYTLIEDVNNRFLERVLPPGNGLLMKPEGLRGGILSLGDTWESYVPRFRPDRDATPHEQRRVMELAALVSQTDVGVFRSKIGTYLDVDAFLRFIAVHAFIGNTDSYLTGGHNFYFYLDPSDDKFRFIPWDQDLSMGGRNSNAFGGMDLERPYAGDQPLIYWLLDDPAVMSRYRAILRELSRTAFSKAEIGRTMDALEKVGASRGGSPRQFIETRAAQVEALVASWGK